MSAKTQRYKEKAALSFPTSRKSKVVAVEGASESAKPYLSKRPLHRPKRVALSRHEEALPTLAELKEKMATGQATALAKAEENARRFFGRTRI